MELFSRGDIRDISDGAPCHFINIGPHENAVVCYLSDEMADLIVESANVFSLGARDFNVSPLELARATGGQLFSIITALAWALAGLESAEVVIDNDLDADWGADIWDEDKGIPGYARKLIIEALGIFPPIKIVRPLDATSILLKQMRDHLAEVTGSFAAPDLVAQANKLLGDQ